MKDFFNSKYLATYILGAQKSTTLFTGCVIMARTKRQYKKKKKKKGQNQMNAGYFVLGELFLGDAGLTPGKEGVMATAECYR